MKLAVLSDLAEENWPSMDLVSEMLVEHAGKLPGLEVTNVRPELPRSLGESIAAGTRLGRSLGLAFARYALYPLQLPRLRGRFDCFHVADHSYAHLTLGLPRSRTGVFCHDIDAFRPMLGGARPGWRKRLAELLARGMRRASVVPSMNRMLKNGCPFCAPTS